MYFYLRIFLKIQNLVWNNISRKKFLFLWYNATKIFLTSSNWYVITGYSVSQKRPMGYYFSKCNFYQILKKFSIRNCFNIYQKTIIFSDLQEGRSSLLQYLYRDFQMQKLNFLFKDRDSKILTRFFFMLWAIAKFQDPSNKLFIVSVIRGK